MSGVSSTSSRFFGKMLLPTALLTITALFYWMYKKFRAPAYIPGMVAKLVAEEEEDKSSSSSSTASFDNPELHSKSTETTWVMPDGMELYHFPVAAASSTSSNNNNGASFSSFPIVAIHGGPAITPTKPWNLCKSFPTTMHLYHARGCGKSTRPFVKFPTPGRMWPGMKILEETLGIGAQLADIERIRRRLVDNNNKNNKIDIVGHSFGGFLAAMYAAEFPDRVRSLTLLVPADVLRLPARDGDYDLFQTIKEKLEKNDNITQKHLDEYDAFMKRYFDFGSLPNETDETLAARHAEFAVHYYRANASGGGGTEDAATKSPPPPPPIELAQIGGMTCYATYLSMGMEHDYGPVCRERLAQSTFPVSIVHGTADMVSESTSRKYIDLFPKDNVKFYTVEGADHDLFDHPEVVDIVKEILGRVD